MTLCLSLSGYNYFIVSVSTREDKEDVTQLDFIKWLFNQLHIFGI